MISRPIRRLQPLLESVLDRHSKSQGTWLRWTGSECFEGNTASAVELLCLSGNWKLVITGKPLPREIVRRRGRFCTF
jgi:hypothetical protein